MPETPTSDQWPLHWETHLDDREIRRMARAVVRVHRRQRRRTVGGWLRILALVVVVGGILVLSRGSVAGVGWAVFVVVLVLLARADASRTIWKRWAQDPQMRARRITTLDDVGLHATSVLESGTSAWATFRTVDLVDGVLVLARPADDEFTPLSLDGLDPGVDRARLERTVRDRIAVARGSGDEPAPTGATGPHGEG